MSDFNKKLAVVTDEVSQVQPLYREEIVKGIKRCDTVNVDGKFATNGKLIKYPKVKLADVVEKQADGTYKNRAATVNDTVVKGTDGIFEMEYLHITNENGKCDVEYIGFITLLECKLDQDFQDKMYRAAVILQCICYMKLLAERGERIPDILFIGSKKNCFILPKTVVERYIVMNIQGYTSASTAYIKNADIVRSIAEDEEVLKHCYIRNIDDTFEMKDVINDIYDYVTGIGENRKISSEELSKAFDIFSMQVLLKSEKYSGREQAKWFLKLILEPDVCYLHPKKQSKLIIGDDCVDVDTDKYKAFRVHYGVEKAYTLQEQREFTAIADRLIEDADRRRRGDFYTPTVWVDEAHKLISKHLGNNWRNEYMVYDCCWGTGNLTRDYKFKELYCSTLIASDLALAEKYNRDAVKFQYDFLNDDVDIFEKLEKIKAERGYLTVADFIEHDVKMYNEAPGLIKGLIEGKKLLFLINPPYGAATNLKNKITGDKAKTDIATTNKIVDGMKADKIGAATQNLYIQFYYRIKKICNLFDVPCIIGSFTPTAVLTGASVKGFRSFMFKDMQVTDGYVLQASSFANVAGNWGILFALLQSSTDIFKDNTSVRVLQYNVNGVSFVQNKRLYNMDNALALSDWVREPVKQYKAVDAPQFTSALSYVAEHKQGNLVNGALGYGVFGGNIVDENNQGVFILSSCRSMGHGVSILPENFKRVCVAFTARRLITGPYATWVNWQDEYMIPNIFHQDYVQFESDSIVYFLFNTKSNQASLRDITYNGKQWNIKNEFFWLSCAEMKALAQGTYNIDDVNNEVEQDLIDNAEDERYVYKLLQQVTLSSDAKAVLDKAGALIRKSFKYRKSVALLHPEYYLNTWDMGYYQLNKLIQEIPELQEEWRVFRQLYKGFEDRMRPLVYELGFLYK